MYSPQTMNKVFEHAGDLVNVKVAHNLMRLIAEGFGEDDDAADSQLRSSAVCYLIYSLFILDAYITPLCKYFCMCMYVYPRIHKHAH